MSQRGWGGPSIREGSHPPPYMSIQHDLKECHAILDEIAELTQRTSSLAYRMEAIRRALGRRPKRHE